MTIQTIRAIIELEQTFKGGIPIQTVNLAVLDGMADVNTPQALLPSHLRSGGNERRLRYLKKELYRVIASELTAQQRDCVLLHYWKGMRRKDIAAAKSVSCGQVTKYMHAAEKTLESRLTSFLELYDGLERELLAEI